MTDTPKVEAGPSNGRRPENQSNVVDDVKNDDAEHEVDDTSEDKPKRKRRAVVSDKTKKYQCPHPDCDKVYSRAEHLSRHNLNHNPKTRYYCEHPGCDRDFVRADLCARHQQRHTEEGSTLQRREQFGGTKGRSSLSASARASTTSALPIGAKHQTYTLSAEQHLHQPASNGRNSTHTKAGATRKQRRPATSSYDGRSANNSAIVSRPSSPSTSRRFSADGRYQTSASVSNGYGQHQVLPVSSMPPPLAPQSSGALYSQSVYSPARNEQYQSLSSYPTQSTTPTSLFPDSTSYGGPAGFLPGYQIPLPGPNSTNRYGLHEDIAPGITDVDYHAQYNTHQALDVFTVDGIDISPQPWQPDELWQFPDSGLINMENSFENQEFSRPVVLGEVEGMDAQLGGTTPRVKPTIAPAIDSRPSQAQGMDRSKRESDVSATKQDRLVELVRSFGDLKDTTGRSMKEAIFVGNIEDPNHVLSVNMLRTCLASYWTHFHQQMPILHRPTFNPITCPDLLLLTMVCLGACCLGRTELSQESIDKCAQLALFSAHHIRWEVFKDADFRPTAKLWTFQTMLLLELFEKMFSTRVLHERAHIHHATTLTVMRRGSSLIGRAIEQPDAMDPTRTPPGAEGTINTSGTNTGDADWNRWINAEATRRVAFAAFIIDSTHASLFGHAAVMSHNDLRLSLPCNESLWSAPNFAAVQQGEKSLAESGVKPTSFLEGLKCTLSRQKVHTNVFGRVILMAGLLNVSWHINQRDLQRRSLGNDTTSSNQKSADKKAASTNHLTAAFESWKRDLDDNLPAKQEQQTQDDCPQSTSACHAEHSDNVPDSGSCLVSLAHMSTHVEIVDCEVFAGAKWSLGRKVFDVDRINIQNKIRAWASTSRARDATFYAVRFLCDVLLPPRDLDPKQSPADDIPDLTYSARDDYLVNRPWILYFAVMVVWSYGYALDGPLSAAAFTLTTRERAVSDMRVFLQRAKEYKSPDELQDWTGRNECLGLLMMMRECLKQPRWELLHEASDILGLCIEKLLPDNDDMKGSFGMKELRMEDQV